MRYSLADYILTIKSNDAILSQIFNILSIGGNGDDVGSITASHDDDLWSTTPYATGGYVHNKNLSKVGKVNISLNQLAPQISKLKKLCEVWRANDCGGLTITLTSASGNETEKVFSAIDCYLVKEPDQAFGNTAADQDWQFTVGELTFN